VTYAFHAAKIAAGIAVAAVGRYAFEHATQTVEVLLAGAVTVAALWLAAHGLFTGVEAAVRTGRERPDSDSVRGRNEQA
jgi:ABC-type proline/glycine betaine transport system permease subunit